MAGVESGSVDWGRVGVVEAEDRVGAQGAQKQHQEKWKVVKDVHVYYKRVKKAP